MRFRSASTHWNAGSVLCGAELHLTVQVDVAVAACELEHFEGEGVGHSGPVGHHIHRLVLRVGTPVVTCDITLSHTQSKSRLSNSEIFKSGQ